jgi:hypothetical protein
VVIPTDVQSQHLVAIPLTLPIFPDWKDRRWKNRSMCGIVLKGKNAWQILSNKDERGSKNWKTKWQRECKREDKRKE